MNALTDTFRITSADPITNALPSRPIRSRRPSAQPDKDDAFNKEKAIVL